eukprot:3595312-Pleurochrysis_carterae.AAC.2
METALAYARAPAWALNYLRAQADSKGRHGDVVPVSAQYTLHRFQSCCIAVFRSSSSIAWTMLGTTNASRSASLRYTMTKYLLFAPSLPARPCRAQMAQAPFTQESLSIARLHTQSSQLIASPHASVVSPFSSPYHVCA